MARVVPLVLILAALIVAAVVLFGGGDDDGGYLPEDDPLGQDPRADPELLTSEAAKRKKVADDAAAAAAAKAKRTSAPPTGTVLFLEGTVVDAATGAPLGATLRAEPAGTCPRLPWALALAVSGANSAGSWTPLLPDPGVVTTDARGAFRWMVAAKATTQLQAVDVAVIAAGYVPAMLCRPGTAEDVTIRLQRALPLQVSVVDAAGRPVEGAAVTVRPGPETEVELGHAAYGSSDRDGRCTLDGLLPGGVVVHADHPAYMPAQTEPLDPATTPSTEIRLPPALRLTFVVRSDDGSPVVNPLVQWETDGKPSYGGVQLLKLMERDGPAAEVRANPIRVPCDHRNIHLEVKAKGFEAWRQTEPLPADGGERTLIATLVRDTSLANLEIAFEGPDGKSVDYIALGPSLPTIARLDGKEVGSLTIESGKRLVFDSLPAGPYRIGKRSPEYAPVELDVDVRAGEVNTVTAKLRPPAKLRLRFTADKRHVVGFRLLRGSDVLHAFREGGAGGGEDGGGFTPLTAHGNEGAVFTGLSAGPCTIEITTPGLTAPSRTVQLQEGATSEVEIEVRER